MAQVHPGLLHLLQKPAPRVVIAHLTDGKNGEAWSPADLDIVRDDVQLAVIAAIQKAPAAALLAPQRVVAVQSEEDARADAAGADQRAVAAAADVHAQRRPYRLPSYAQIPLRVLADRVRAVSTVAVSSASGCSCSRVMGYSGVSGPKSATRRAVCFQAPVSLNRRTFPADRHSFTPEGDRHRRHELIGGAEGALGQRQDGVQVVLLDADGGLAHVVQRDVAERVAAGLVVGDVPILPPAAVGDVDRRCGDALGAPSILCGRQPVAIRLGHGQLGVDRAIEMLAP